jgi:hypothetical protein
VERQFQIGQVSDRSRRIAPTATVDFKVNFDNITLMKKSISQLQPALGILTRRARDRKLTDSQWAEAAGLRKETLSRLRHRRSCDFATLQALANVVGFNIGVLGTERTPLTEDMHYPAKIDRAYEEDLLDLCASGDLDPRRWLDLGPGCFMAGMAVMLASVRGFDRRKLLALAERLHPGASEPEVFTQWLERSEVRPSRFLPLLEMRAQRAA